MLDITYGQTHNQIATSDLVNALRDLDLEGSLYLGYPILATADESVLVDALLVSVQRGLVAFSFADNSFGGGTELDAWTSLADRQDKLYVAIENSLRRHDDLRVGRRLAVEVQTVTVVPDASDVPSEISGSYADFKSLRQVIDHCEPIDGTFMKPLQAALQRVSTIKPPKRRAQVTSPSSKGAILRHIEREIANLDQWQKQAAVESPDAPQRIRGLAGSGKTVVLALKAAYLHSVNPDWKIALTFWSRALYQQFEDLVRRFSFEHSNDEPNWQNLHILHAWGSRFREGLYSEIAQHCGVTPRDYRYGQARYGMSGAFEGVCSELLAALDSSTPDPIYDAVLIDEAQDLPVPFFRIVHKMVRPPKRIVWAYDELQNLSDNMLPTVEHQFGTDSQGKPNVELANLPDSPRQDVILPICYRNTPWALTLAHGLGLGTSRNEGLVQSFDVPSLWLDIGYALVDGTFEKGQPVTLQRAPNSYPSYFPEYITPTDSVSTHVFTDAESQAHWVAQSIKRNLEEDELEHDDILIVLPQAYTIKTEGNLISTALGNLGIASHIAGHASSRDELFEAQSIAIAHIYRSKGNEAPMVYVLNSQYCVEGRGLTRLRNTLFTAITRSRAWVRICGWGEGMQELQGEIEFIQQNNYRLQFAIPTDEELAHIRRINREPTTGEQARFQEAQRNLESLVEAFDRGDISIEDIPPHLKTAVVQIFLGGGHLDSATDIN